MTPSAHALATEHLPIFITAPGGTDVLFWVTGIALLVVLLIGGNLFLMLHSLPERMAHKSQKLQFEIVAVLCLLALFTHIHLFRVAGLEPPPEPAMAPDDEQGHAPRRGGDHA